MTLLFEPRVAHRGRRPHVVLAVAMIAIALLGPAATASAGGRAADRLPPERPDDPPGVPAPVAVAPGAPRAASVITFGRFTHRQVNVNGAGANIPGDAANEPSIAVDPTDHNHMVIGWRQFDTVASNFRQAGFGYTTDGGVTWTTGKLEAGVFRSDPVLGVDATGRFLYNSLTSTSSINSWVFATTDGGASWSTRVFGYGGDKQWMAVDRTGGPGNGFLYQAWSVAGNDYYPSTFNRSTNGGASFQSPSRIVGQPIWGTLDLDSERQPLRGRDGSGQWLRAGWRARRTPRIRSSHRASPRRWPTRPATINVGGPNPAGLDGQVWIAVDRSAGPRHNWVYVLASLQTATDPLDVMFTRSTDGGRTWSAPVRVNDDPVSSKAWQWFGTMSVAPNGRMDAVWNDSRLTGDSTRTALFYSCSYDGGVTWTPNEQASPVWDCTVGYPNQQKIGDYYQMISDDTGADLAWAATFNNEEDVYYTRITPGLVGVADGASPPSRRLAGAPNPFSSVTTIRFDVPPAGARVKLEVFDVAGHRVTTLADGRWAGGSQSIVWNGRDGAGRMAGPGLYFCRYRTDGVAETRKLMRIR